MIKQETKPTVDIAVCYAPGWSSEGDYCLVDFLISPGRLMAWGFPTPESVREWVRKNPSTLVSWRWRDDLYADDGHGKLVPWPVAEQPRAAATARAAE